MNGALRSKQGCWTCRLRRKKCDERHPTCTTCVSLAITCYGYGGKPDWMDGGEREKTMANSIKQIVKHTSRRKGRFGFSVGRNKEKIAGDRDAVAKPVLAPATPSVGIGSIPGSSCVQDRFGAHVTSSLGTSPDASNGEQSANSPAPMFHSLSETPNIQPSDAMLLMHFLDHVFPLQYPMYHPSVLAGGRGWFLHSLLRTKPLYHAALALSSYHHGVAVYGIALDRQHGMRLSKVREVDNWVGCPAQERHIQMSLKAFQEQIESSKRWMSEQKCPSDTLGLMGGVVQLTYFELFAGRGDTWQMHLRAATDLFRDSFPKQVATLNLTDSLKVMSANEVEQTYGEGLVTEDVATFRFLCGILVWLDILSSVTGGKIPRLFPFHSQLISSTSGIKLEDIVGVKNWVVVQIGTISSLHEWKLHGLGFGLLQAQDLEEKAEGIREVIRDGLAADCLESLGITDVHIPAIYNPLLITRLFALAASVYLHLVVYGFETSTSPLEATMREAMGLLKVHMPWDLMHAVVFPLYIFGCNAQPADEDWFRDVLGREPVKERSMEHRGKLLPLMERIWRCRRETCEGWSWQRNLLLSEYNLLLV